MYEYATDILLHGSESCVSQEKIKVSLLCTIELFSTPRHHIDRMSYGKRVFRRMCSKTRQNQVKYEWAMNKYGLIA